MTTPGRKRIAAPGDASKRRRTRRLLRQALALCATGAALIIAVANIAVRESAKGRIAGPSDYAAKLPACRAAFVLGCSERIPDGRMNAFFIKRVDAAARLYRAGVIDTVVVSGDNHVSTYDEPSAMKAALVRRGVPGDRILCDYAGFRTLDTVVRAREVFGQDRFILVSQRFHLARAIFLARARGIDAYGFAADDVPRRFSFKTRLREQLARARALSDVALARRPRFLGPKVPLPPELGQPASEEPPPSS